MGSMLSIQSGSRIQRRTAWRDSVTIPVSVFSELFANPVDVDSSNLSPTGMFLATDLLLEPGDLVLVHFSLPGVNHEWTADGRVVRASKNRLAGIGVEFARLPRMDAQILRIGLDRLRARMPPDPRSDSSFRC